MENRKAKICVPVRVRRAAELAGAVKRAAEIGDFVEIRFDYLAADELAEAMRAYAELRNAVACPFIVTFRPDEEGGCRTISLDERSKFWKQCRRALEERRTLSGRFRRR